MNIKLSSFKIKKIMVRRLLIFHLIFDVGSLNMIGFGQYINIRYHKISILYHFISIFTTYCKYYQDEREYKSVVKIERFLYT